MGSDLVNGWNLNRLEFGNGQERLGTLQQVGRREWVEDSVVAGQTHFEYAELRRDEWSVYLHDASRDVHLQLDLHTRRVKYGTGAAAALPLYVVIDASHRPHGRLVNRVEIGSGGTVQGVLRQVASGDWVEDGDVRDRFRYAESARDDWSVYLHDASRDVSLQLDLHTRRVLYGPGLTATTPIYDIVSASDVVNGWLVNLVEIGSGSQVAGVLRQATTDSWVEDGDVPDRFRYSESSRDDWSVYLHDASRDVSLQVDLHTRTVLYGSGSPVTPIYDVVSATDAHVPPKPVPASRVVDGLSVNYVEVGSKAARTGSFRQVGRNAWVEEDADGEDRFRFDERSRDEWSVYLHDPTRNMALQLDLHTQKVMIGAGTMVRKELAAIVAASDEVTGWLVTEVGVQPGGTSRGFRQVDWTTWAELDAQGAESFEFQQTARDDWSVYLEDRRRDVSLQLDLYTKVVSVRERDSPMRPLYRIDKSEAGTGVWVLGEQITSRSKLSSLYRAGSTTASDVVYRTSISVSPDTRWVELRASEEVVVTVRGAQHTIDPVRPLRVEPSEAAKVLVSLPATSLRCAALDIRTNLMAPDARHVILPDVDVHQKLAGLKAGDLRRARAELGVPADVSDTSLDVLQDLTQRMVDSVQYAYNLTPNGIHHDRAVRPGNMRTSAFSVDFGASGAVSTELSPAESAAMVGSFSAGTADAGQALLDDVGQVFGRGAQLAKVGITTGLRIGGELVATGGRVLDHGGTAFDKAGERFVAGDPIGGLTQLMQGGENVGRELDEGGQRVLQHGEEGAREVLLITIATLEGKKVDVEATTSDVLDLVTGIVEQVGVVWDRFTGWLAETIGWDAVRSTHDAILSLLQDTVAQTPRLIPELKSQNKALLTSLRQEIGGVRPSPAAPAASAASSPDVLSDAMSHIDWVLDELMGDLPDLDIPGSALRAFHGPDVVGLFGERLGEGLVGALSRGGESIGCALGSGPPGLENIAAALTDTAEQLGASVVDAVADSVDDILDPLADTLALVGEVTKLPLPVPVINELYTAATDRRTMTVGGFLAFLLAIPVTSTYRTLLGEDPVFATVGKGLDDQDNKGWSVTYGVTHIVLAAISVWQKGGSIMADAASLVFSLLAQAIGSPQPVDRTASVVTAPMQDLIARPSEMARQVWHYQWLLFGFQSLDFGFKCAGRKKEGEYELFLLPAAYGVLGLGHLTLMTFLGEADRAKIEFLRRFNSTKHLLPRSDAEKALHWAHEDSQIDEIRKALVDFSANEKAPVDLLTGKPMSVTAPVSSVPSVDAPKAMTQDQWLAGVDNYYRWSTDTRRPVSKTICNIADCVPMTSSMLKYGGNKTGVVLATALAVVGHLGEAAWYLGRTANNELL